MPGQSLEDAQTDGGTANAAAGKPDADPFPRTTRFADRGPTRFESLLFQLRNRRRIGGIRGDLHDELLALSGLFYPLNRDIQKFGVVAVLRFGIISE